jgi:hypothetical protein
LALPKSVESDNLGLATAIVQRISIYNRLDDRRIGATYQKAIQKEKKMSTLLIIVILLLIFGGGGGYYAYGGAGLGGVLGTVLIILLILWLLGRLR